MYHNKSELEVAEASIKAAAAAGVPVYGPGAAYLQFSFSLQVLLNRSQNFSVCKYNLNSSVLANS
jgi:hypothetical protein